MLLSETQVVYALDVDINSEAADFGVNQYLIRLRMLEKIAWKDVTSIGNNMLLSPASAR